MKNFVVKARLFVVLTRPAVAVLFALLAATGLAQAGHGDDRWVLARVLAVVVGYLVFSVALNDISDEAIDRVNLPGRRDRPLASGRTNRRDMAMVGCSGGVAALVASATLSWPAIIVVVVGLAFSAAYSLKPVRIADRGALASLLLPAAYVAVPYLTGIFAVSTTVTSGDLEMLTALYAGFIARLLLKDFRDVRGDALFGKRTFLVRHGRRPTCLASAVFWSLGTAGIADAGPHLAVVLAADASSAVVSLALLVALAHSGRPRRDESIIATLAIVGRSTIAVLLLSLCTSRWPPVTRDAVLIGFSSIVTLQGVRMLRRGPATTLKVPERFQVPQKVASQPRRLP